MAKYPQQAYVRVKDDKGNEFTTSPAFAKSADLDVIDKPAVDKCGNPLPDKPKRNPERLPDPEAETGPQGEPEPDPEGNPDQEPEPEPAAEPLRDKAKRNPEKLPAPTAAVKTNGGASASKPEEGSK